MCVPPSIQFFRDFSFELCTALSSFTLEYESKLTRIKAGAVGHCSSLQSICILASVTFFEEGCFYSCKASRFIKFEPGSKLTRIDAEALCGRSLPESFHFSVPLERIECSALSDTGICKITIDEGCCQFRVPDDVVLWFEGRSVIRS
jgi:hypothetical protein